MFTFIYNVITKSAVVLIVALLGANYLPKQLFHDFPFEPKSVESPKFDTVIPQDWNTKLTDKATYIQPNALPGPESIAISPTGLLYTGLADGRLVELDPHKDYKIREVLRFKKLPKCKDDIPYEAVDCGRFLQLRFVNSTLYALEASSGLYKVDVRTGTKTLVGPKVQLNPINMYNSFAFDPEDSNLVYVTISSTKWDLAKIMWSILELEANGQVIVMDINTGKRVVVLDQLLLPNGIDVDHKRDQLLFSETTKSRVSSLTLSALRANFLKVKDGQKMQDVKVNQLIPLLPGMPDNIHVKGDIAYIAIPFVRLNGSELIDNLSDAPMLRKSFSRLVFGIGKILEYVCENFYHHPMLEWAFKEIKTGHIFYWINYSKHSAVLEYNLASHTSRLFGSQQPFISEATLDKDGNWFLGSFRLAYIVKTRV